MLRRRGGVIIAVATDAPAWRGSSGHRERGPRQVGITTMPLCEARTSPGTFSAPGPLPLRQRPLLISGWTASARNRV